ncbi:T9SS type A sorting domain-containing protein [Botryobacter ruber]|uniref:T9SS type A sorting domain-containing protein n=1 Tax=Botryobacter ruber TaxID=2171629 RepID=UPI000E0AF903|nr:T9SS type A sorting domain-containing protein [Botryobacter ruber]
MKKIYLLLGTVFFVCGLFHVALAQTSASARWSLVNPDNGGTGEEVAITGEVQNAVMTLTTMEKQGYLASAENTLRMRMEGNAMPASQLDTITNTYVQFAVSPTAGKSLNVTSLSYDLVASGTGNMKAKVFYSTTPSFKNATLLEEGTGLADNAVSRVTGETGGTGFTAVNKTISAMVNSGQTFYLRFYPWVHNASSTQSGKYIAIRNLTISGTTTAGGGAVTPKKVGYVMSNKTMAENTADPIVAMLQADPNIDVTVHAVAGDATVDLSGYDVVVVQEGFGSGDNIYKPAGSLGLANITVPFLYNKTYALRNGRAVVTGGGTSADIGDTAIVVSEANRSNDLFKGITFTNGAFPVFKTRATDLGGSGAEAVKTFNYTHGLTISAENTLLGTVPAIDAIENKNQVMFLNDIPAGTTIGDQVLRARMIAVGLNTGAMMKDNGTNMTAEGLTLMRNAIYSLAGLTIPNTGIVTSLAAETKNASFNLGQNYPNPFHAATTIAFELKKAGHVTLEVYDITGKRVAMLAEGLKTAGVHEVKLNNSNLKNGIYFYKLSANGATATRKMLISK